MQVNQRNIAKEQLAQMGNPNMIGADFNGNGGIPAPFTGYYEPKPQFGLNFTGNANSFANELQSGKYFRFTISNTGANSTDKLIALFPGRHTSAADIVVPQGVTIDAIVGDGTILAASGAGVFDAVTCTGSPMRVADFLNFIDKSPVRFPKIQIKSNSADQLAEDIQIVKVDAFQGFAPYQLSPGNYTSEKNQSDKMVTFYSNSLQADNQTIAYFKLLAGTSVIITLWPGATANLAADLAGEAKKALVANIFDHEKYNEIH